MRKKRLLSAFLTLAVAVGAVAGCSSSQTGSGGSTEEKGITVGVFDMGTLYLMQTFDEMGYYKDNGLNVEVVSGGGDVSETVAVSNGTVDFGVTWVSNLINANAGGMELLEVAQVYQRSGLVLCYKKSQFTK